MYSEKTFLLFAKKIIKINRGVLKIQAIENAVLFWPTRKCVSLFVYIIQLQQAHVNCDHR